MLVDEKVIIKKKLLTIFYIVYVIVTIVAIVLNGWVTLVWLNMILMFVGGCVIVSIWIWIPKNQLVFCFFAYFVTSCCITIMGWLLLNRFDKGSVLLLVMNYIGLVLLPISSCISLYLGLSFV